MMRVGIAGFGYMGKERLQALISMKEKGENIQIVGICDPYFVDDKTGTGFKSLNFFGQFSDLLSAGLDWLIIATPHDVAQNFCKEALAKNIKVLIEKPLGRNAREAKQLVDAQRSEDQLWVGLNYRFFVGIHQLIKDVKKGLFGSLISINAIIGHGYSPEGAQTWKLDKNQAGGGVLIDPGIHILDLLILLAGKDLDPVCGLKYEGFWKTGVEEECHLLMRSSQVPMINFQVSLVKWRSTFGIEVYGTDGYGIISGRGRSYGAQTYVRGNRWGWQSGKPQRETEELVSKSEDHNVFETELQAVFSQPSSGEIKPSRAHEALQAMQLLSKCRRIFGIKE